jgi:hypothetical protein
MARRQLDTARLNGSVGESFAVGFGLMLEDIARFSLHLIARLDPAIHLFRESDGCAGQTRA